MEAIIKTTKAIASRESSGERNRNREQSREINQESDYDKMRNEQDMQEVSGINNYEVIKAIMARILLNQNILNRKARIDIEHDLDSYYHHFPEQDNQISEEQIQSAMDTKLKGFERERVEKKLNYANNTQQVQAPDFALTSGKNEDKLASHKYIWQGKNKFSNEKHQNITELLTHLNSVQKLHKMCEEEFKNFMLQNLTKDVFTQVRQEFQAGSTVSTVYTLLQVLYSKEVSPATYKDKLKAYKATKADTMHSAFSTVRRLASLSMDPTLSQNMKNQLLNIESLYQFINCMPIKSKLKIQERLGDYQAENDSKIPDAHEFFASVATMRDTVDRDIAQNGVSTHTKPNRYNTYALDRTEEEYVSDEPGLDDDYTSSEDKLEPGEEYIPKKYLMAMIRNQNRANFPSRGNNRGQPGYQK